MGRTLYVSDLDGTLLNKQDRINPKSIRIINDLVERGMTFTYATARSLSSASIVTQGLSAAIPVIVYNGAFILQPSTGEILSKESFQEEEMEWVEEVLDRFDICPLVYSFVEEAEKVSWITSRENEGIQRYIDSRKGDKRLRPVSAKEELYRGDMFYFTCIGEMDELRPVYDRFAEDTRFRCTFQQEL